MSIGKWPERFWTAFSFLFLDPFVTSSFGRFRRLPRLGGPSKSPGQNPNPPLERSGTPDTVPPFGPHSPCHACSPRWPTTSDPIDLRQPLASQLDKCRRPQPVSFRQGGCQLAFSHIKRADNMANDTKNMVLGEVGFPGTISFSPGRRLTTSLGADA